MQKILFIRHGESVDDLTDQYGGWAEFPLTPRGSVQLTQMAQEVSKLKVEFKLVLSSPLSKAQESARIIANRLSIPLRTFIYLKKKNGYGLLSGLNKEFALKEYPELVKAMEAGYAFGAEPDVKFTERVRVAVRTLLEMKKDLIAVTHGGFMGRLFGDIRKKYEKAEDRGFVLVTGDSLQDIIIAESNGILYS